MTAISPKALEALLTASDAEAREVVLRQSQARGELEPIVSECERVLGERSRSRLALLLQMGDIAGAERWARSAPQRPRLGARQSALEELERALRASVCASFD